MPRQDAIVRRVHVRAPIERVWRAVTRADELASWFGDAADVDLRVGGSIRFGWSEYDDTTTGVIERIEPPNVFSYRWEQGRSADGHVHWTVVTFTLAEVDGGTNVTVEETGLDALPDELYDRTLEENSSGWTAELADLVSYVGDGR